MHRGPTENSDDWNLKVASLYEYRLNIVGLLKALITLCEIFRENNKRFKHSEKTQISMFHFNIA